MTTREKLVKTLETHFCDLEETEEYENNLRENAVAYFDGLSLKKLAEYYKALGDEKRLGILVLLGFREMCVCELTASLGISQPNLSHHIRKLENAGLVRSERRGKWVYYNLVDDAAVSRLFIQ